MEHFIENIREFFQGRTRGEFIFGTENQEKEPKGFCEIILESSKITNWSYEDGHDWEDKTFSQVVYFSLPPSNTEESEDSEEFYQMLDDSINAIEEALSVLLYEEHIWKNPPGKDWDLLRKYS